MMMMGSFAIILNAYIKDDLKGKLSKLLFQILYVKNLLLIEDIYN